METLPITRVLVGQRRGRGRPVLVDTPAGPRLVKLRGAAQGTGALVAEIVVAALAEALDLRVPARSLLTLAAATPSDDRDDELGDLLAASVGLNLGFAVLEGARELGAADHDGLDPAEQAAILWLDGLVMNPDRTAANPNLLLWRDRLWLIDHGAALRFQYDWSAVTEASPRAPGLAPAPHVFAESAAAPDWPTWDEAFASRLTRPLLEEAVAAVPDSFLLPLLPSAGAAPDALARRRAAYVAFLWKRLAAPRAFAAGARA